MTSAMSRVFHLWATPPQGIFSHTFAIIAQEVRRKKTQAEMVLKLHATSKRNKQFETLGHSQ